MVGLLVFFLFITAGLFNIQVTNHERYKYLAERQQYKSEKIVPLRGVIKDCNGEILAYSKKNVSFYVDTRMMNEKKINSIAAKFSKVFKRSEKYYKSLIKNGSRNVRIEGHVREQDAEQLKSFLVDGLFSSEESQRIYPYGDLGSHLLGYVDGDNSGKDGVEGSYNEMLTGHYGSRLLERDVIGRTVSVIDNYTKPAEDGNTLVLTINKTYQNALEEGLKKGLEEFGGKSVIGIMMNPSNGEILALSSVPTFDPADYNRASNETRRNIALTDTYEPGSTFKAVIMSALLNEGLAKENEKINTENGVYKIKNVRIRDVHKNPFLTVREVLEQSSNIGMSKLVDRIDDNTLYKYIRDFGFGNTTNIDLPGESGGYLKKPSSYSKISKYFLSFGYEISVTPIQMVSAFCAIINGGNLYKPYIVKEVVDKKGNVLEENKPVKIRQVISKETSEKLKDFMTGVVEEGTAKMARLDKVAAGGKTGTSQKYVNHEYSKEFYNSSFVGFFPADNPKVVCFILVNSPQKAKYGGTVAAPIFKTVAEKMIDGDISLIPENAPKLKRDNMLREFMADLRDENEAPLFVTSDIGEEKNNEEAAPQNAAVPSLGYMPDLGNKSMREAISELTRIGLKYKITGSGSVLDQSIKPGKKIFPGDMCVIKCSAKEIKSTIKLN